MKIIATGGGGITPAVNHALDATGEDEKVPGVPSTNVRRLKQHSYRYPLSAWTLCFL